MTAAGAGRLLAVLVLVGVGALGALVLHQGWADGLLVLLAALALVAAVVLLTADARRTRRTPAGRGVSGRRR